MARSVPRFEKVNDANGNQDGYQYLSESFLSEFVIHRPGFLIDMRKIMSKANLPHMGRLNL